MSAQAKTIVRHMAFVPCTSTVMGRATRNGVAAHYVEFAGLRHVTRNRMTRIEKLAAGGDDSLAEPFSGLCKVTRTLRHAK